MNVKSDIVESRLSTGVFPMEAILFQAASLGSPCTCTHSSSTFLADDLYPLASG